LHKLTNYTEENCTEENCSERLDALCRVCAMSLTARSTNDYLAINFSCQIIVGGIVHFGHQACRHHQDPRPRRMLRCPIAC